MDRTAVFWAIPIGNDLFRDGRVHLVGRCSVNLPIVECGDKLPVCLVGDRLVFTVDCIVTMNWAGVTVWREEKEGNSWDGASIPKITWSVIGHPLEKDFRWASFWHDRWCENAQYIEDRTVGDSIFLRLLMESNVPKWKRLAMWSAVRLYGLLLWKPERE